MKFKKIVITLAISVLFVLFLDFNIIASTNGNEEINSDEYNKIELLVFNETGVSDFDYELISGISEINRYVLVTYENGYLIYDRLLEDYTEHSISATSPYKNVIGKKIYFAPTFYYYEADDKMYDIQYMTELTSEEIDSLTTAEINIKNNIIIEKQKGTSPTLNEKIALSSTSSEIVGITDSHYFEKLGLNMGINNTGTCTLVAMLMILSYYDTFLNDNIIDEEFDANSDRPTFTGINDINFSKYLQSPGIINQLHLDFIDLAQEVLSKCNTFELGEIAYLLSLYCQENFLDVNIYVDEYLSLSGDDIDGMTYCKEIIDRNLPVMIHIYGRNPDLSNNVLNHVVVGYKYDSTGIYTNFGWSNNYRSVKLGSSFTSLSIEGAMYFSFNEEHVHSNNYIWNGKGCEGTYCPCGYVECNHNSSSYIEMGSSYHVIDCDFCDISIEEHVMENRHDGNSHYLRCVECGYETIPVENSFVTYNMDEIYHISYCVECKYKFTEEHNTILRNEFWHAHTVECTVCDYFVIKQHEENIAQDINNPNQHINWCPCGFSYTIAHFHNDINHCTPITGNNLNHQSICICGVEFLEQHIPQSKTYGFYNNIQHSVKCYHCEMVYLESHQMSNPHGYSSCINCNYSENTAYRLLIDPHIIYTVGTEITLNNGQYGNTFITQGFTRVLYLGPEAPSQSRLAYTFTSSDNSVATISPYGTILAKKPGIVLIKAVYNDDPTKVGCVYVNVMYDSYQGSRIINLTTDMRENFSQNGTEVTILGGLQGGTTIHVGYTRAICIESAGPTNNIQDYIWESSNPSIATISPFGTITGLQKGTITITCRYKYNNTFIGSIQITII